jgi:hypothetical protein
MCTYRRPEKNSVTVTYDSGKHRDVISRCRNSVTSLRDVMQTFIACSRRSCHSRPSSSEFQAAWVHLSARVLSTTQFIYFFRYWEKGGFINLETLCSTVANHEAVSLSEADVSNVEDLLNVLFAFANCKSNRPDGRMTKLKLVC